MCNYDFFYHDGCCHRTIQLTNYCRRTIWRAGMTSELNACTAVSQLLTQTRNNATAESTWKGISGFCRSCAASLNMSSICVDRTYKDTVVTLEDLKPDGSPGTTILSILHKPAISGTISNFLGVLVQDPSKPEETLFADVATDNDVVHYPEYMEYYQPDQLSKAHAVQYITYEHLGGEPSALSKNSLLVINGGFSFTDRAYVNRRFSEDGVELTAIWKEMFEPRGMPWERFNHNCIEDHRIHAKELDNYQKATYEDHEEISNYGREAEGYGEAVAHGGEISTARGTKQSREMTPTASASHVEPLQNNATATVYTGKFYYKNTNPEVRARELTIYNRERMARRNRRLAQEKLQREQLARDEAGKEK